MEYAGEKGSFPWRLEDFFHVPIPPSGASREGWVQDLVAFIEERMGWQQGSPVR